MKKLTTQQITKIERNLKAYLSNFKPIKIFKVNNYFLIYIASEHNRIDISNYFHSCNNIDELNGFLIGMLKGKHNLKYQINTNFDNNNANFLNTFEI